MYKGVWDKVTEFLFFFICLVNVLYIQHATNSAWLKRSSKLKTKFTLGLHLLKFSCYCPFIHNPVIDNLDIDLPVSLGPNLT